MCTLMLSLHCFDVRIKLHVCIDDFKKLNLFYIVIRLNINIGIKFKVMTDLLILMIQT